MNDEMAIRELMADRARGIRLKDVDAVLHGYASELSTFDLVGPLVNKGATAVRQRLADWLHSFEGAIEYDYRDVQLSVSGELAFEHHLTHVRGVPKHGPAVDMWFRETTGFRKLSGQWKVVHQHSSAPFEMGSMKAALDLSPAA